MGRRECSCSQEEKVVLLVGCTQHGKSSLIRSILDYAKCNDEADQVGVGGFGNRSKTKEVKRFSLVAHIQQHELVDEEGQARGVRPGDDEPDDLYDLTPTSTPARKHIHLRIIDTPGLNDSDIPTDGNDVGGASFKADALLHAVDEQHKLAVLKMLAEEGSVHAVCFVLSMSDPLGAALQALYRDYIRLFRACGVSAPFYFIHTKVDNDSMFSDLARQRPGAVNKTFGLPGTVEHHFVNNLPDPECAVSQHLTAWAVANLLDKFRSEQRHEVGDISYPKSHAHLSWDRMLDAVFESHELNLSNSRSALNDSLAILKQRLRGAESLESSEWKSYRRLDEQCDELDTFDLEEVGSGSSSERAHFFSRSRVTVHAYASAPIRDYKDSTSHCYWNAIGTKESVMGSTSMTAYAIGYGSDQYISASLTLYGWRKERQAKRLEQLQSERDACSSEWSRLYGKVKDAKAEIESTSRDIDSRTQEISKLKVDRQSWKMDNIPSDIIKRRAGYLGRSSIIAYAYAIQAQRKFLNPLLTGVNSSDGAKYLYRDKSKTLEAAYEAWTAMVESVTDTRANMKTFLESAGAQKNDLERDLDALAQQGPATGLKDGREKTPKITFKVPDQAKLIQAIHNKLAGRLKDANKHYELTIESNAQALGSLIQALEMVIQEVQSLDRAAEATQEDWEDEQLRAKAAFVAAEAVAFTADQRLLPCSVVAVLNEGSKSYDASDQDPWARLYSEYVETYLCDPQNWEHFRETLDGTITP